MDLHEMDSFGDYTQLVKAAQRWKERTVDENRIDDRWYPCA